MKNLKLTILFILFLTVGYSPSLIDLVYAQTDDERIADLRKQIEQLEQQASQYRGSIAQQQAQARTLNAQINNLKAQIKKIENDMVLTGKKIQKTEIEIDGVRDNIFTTQQKIDRQKEAVSRMLLYLYTRDQENLVGVLAKSANLSDYFRQQQYALLFEDNLNELIDQLQATEDQLRKDQNNLENKKGDLEDLKYEQQAQKISLASATKDKTNLLTVTKGQEAQYQKLLSDVEKKKAAFFNELRELETKTIQGGLYIVRVTASKLPPRGTKLFAWPEDNRRITQGYGMTTYARRGAYGGAPHNGIDMASGYGSPIKSIGDGEIIANGYNSGYGNWVAIKHPPYNLVSVYGHMSSLSFLRVGSPVKMGQVIGYEGSTGNSTGSHLHLSLYRDFFTYMNAKNDQLYFNYFEGSINPNDYL